MTTADTQPLPPELRHVVEQAAASQAAQNQVSAAASAEVSESRESSAMETGTAVLKRYEGGEILRVKSCSIWETSNQRARQWTDDFVLDMDLDEASRAVTGRTCVFRSAAFRSKPSYSSNLSQPSFAGAQSSTATVAEACRRRTN